MPSGRSGGDPFLGATALMAVFFAVSVLQLNPLGLVVTGPLLALCIVLLLDRVERERR